LKMADTDNHKNA